MPSIAPHTCRRAAGRLRAAAALTAVGLLAVGCGGSAGSPSTGSPSAGGGRVVQVVAAENFWGSIVSQIGGSHVRVTSIIDNPNADPHDYEATAADGRTIAEADLVLYNGVGYDPWAAKLLAADQSQATVLNVGRTVGVPDDANPHRWYNPANVKTVVNTVVTDLSKLDPADAGAFRAGRTRFETRNMKTYYALIASIKKRYAGTPVGASESIFAMLSPALGLKLLTPPSFLRAISEGTDVSAADKATIDAQIADHRIKVYVYNSQNATPDVKAQLAECTEQGIPTATITETMTPAGASYEQWQVHQLRGIGAALAKAAG